MTLTLFPEPSNGKTLVVNMKYWHGPGGVYIGRAGKGKDGPFGNPYSFARYGTRALLLFKSYLWKRCDEDPAFRASILALRGQTLICFCVSKTGAGPCHGRIIVEWLEAHAE